MGNSGLKISRLGESQAQRVSSVLTRAFLDDPMDIFLFPSPEKREEQIYNFILRNVEHALVRGEVYLASPSEGVAVWLFPGDAGRPRFTSGDDPRIKLAAEMTGGSFDRLGLITEATGRKHREIMQSEHYYLLFLGVDPRYKMTGVGSALLQGMLQKADDSRLPCYLETMKEENLAFYCRHGFDVAAEDIIAGELRFWALARPPR